MFTAGKQNPSEINRTVAMTCEPTKFAFALVALGVFVSKVFGTRDVNLAMYMYMANHLTPGQCLKLAAYLYAEGLESSAVEELGEYILTTIVVRVQAILRAGFRILIVRT